MRLNSFFLLIIAIIMGSSCVAAPKNTQPLVRLEPLSQKVVINVEQMNLNKLLNVIRTNTESNIILAPEFSGVHNLETIIALPKGMITLRELLDVICIQLEGKWLVTGANGDIVINPLKREILEDTEYDDGSAGVGRYTVDYAGKTLHRVLVDLHKRSGVKIIMYGKVGNIKIEIMMADATLEEILAHIADVYNLRLSYTADGAYRIGRR